MPQVTLDSATAHQLRQARTAVELLDESGEVLGRFIPATDRPPEPQITEEELLRREQLGRGRPLADILKDLEKRA